MSDKCVNYPLDEARNDAAIKFDVLSFFISSKTFSWWKFIANQSSSVCVFLLLFNCITQAGYHHQPYYITHPCWSSRSSSTAQQFWNQGWEKVWPSPLNNNFNTQSQKAKKNSSLWATTDQIESTFLLNMFYIKFCIIYPPGSSCKVSHNEIRKWRG